MAELINARNTAMGENHNPSVLRLTSEAFGNAAVAPGPRALNTAWEYLTTHHGYVSEKTLFIQSTCPDEINRTMGKPVSDYEFMNNDVFHFGGLGGLTGSGRVGLGACCTHIPDGGKVVVIFGPHIGITDEGEVGKVRRRGISKPSISCGAAAGGMGILKGAGYDTNHESVQGVKNAGLNDQMHHFLEVCTDCHQDEKVQSMINHIGNEAANFTTKLFYGIAKRLQDQLIKNSDTNVPHASSPATKFPIAFIGGVQVNTDYKEGGPQQDDLFVPLCFELWEPPECEGGAIRCTEIPFENLGAERGDSKL